MSSEQKVYKSWDEVPFEYGVTMAQALEKARKGCPADHTLIFSFSADCDGSLKSTRQLIADLDYACSLVEENTESRYLDLDTDYEYLGRVFERPIITKEQLTKAHRELLEARAKAYQTAKALGLEVTQPLFPHKVGEQLSPFALWFEPRGGTVVVYDPALKTVYIEPDETTYKIPLPPVYVNPYKAYDEWALKDQLDYPDSNPEQGGSQAHVPIAS